MSEKVLVSRHYLEELARVVRTVENQPEHVKYPITEIVDFYAESACYLQEYNDYLYVYRETDDERIVTDEISLTNYSDNGVLEFNSAGFPYGDSQCVPLLTVELLCDDDVVAKFENLPVVEASSVKQIHWSRGVAFVIGISNEALTCNVFNNTVTAFRVTIQNDMYRTSECDVEIEATYSVGLSGFR